MQYSDHRIVAMVALAGIFMVVLGLFIMNHHGSMRGLLDCAPHGSGFCIFLSPSNHMNGYGVPVRGYAGFLITLGFLLFYCFPPSKHNLLEENSESPGRPPAHAGGSLRHHAVMRWLSLHEKRDPAIA